MKKALTVTMAVLAIMLASASAALADQDPGFLPLTCGTNNPANHPSATYLTYDNGAAEWDAGMNSVCGSHGTFEWELQRTSDNGLHWNDVVNRSNFVIDNKINDSVD